MSLHEAVKRVGGAGRAEKMWRTASSSTGRDKWERRQLTRAEGEVRAVRSVSIQTSMENARTASKYASALREAIQVANGKTLELEGGNDFFDI